MAEKNRELVCDWRFFNPVYYHLDEYLNDPNIRIILLYGGSSSSKTYSILQWICFNQISDNFNVLAMRKQHNKIEETIFAEFKQMCGCINEVIPKQFRVIKNPFSSTSQTGARIVFTGVDNPDHIKGLATYKIIYMNELDLFNKADLDEVMRRLRGRKGQQIVADWNPVNENSWVKKELIDLEQWVDLPLSVEGIENEELSKLDENSSVKMNATGDIVMIQTTFLDNRWMTGSEHEGYGFYDVHAVRNFDRMKKNDYNQYRIYALGQWGILHVENRFWCDFNENTHVRADKDRTNQTIHITVDINRLPYITQTFWVYDGIKREAIEFMEMCAEPPNNTAERAAKLVVYYLKSINYNDILFIYGDASGNNADAKDGKSFFTMYLQELKKHFNVHNRILKVNPSITMSAEFINKAYSGQMPFVIYVNPRCHKSIFDYSTVQQDKDGKMLKPKTRDLRTGATYESKGHISDSKRYFITKIFEAEYNAFTNTRKFAVTSIPDSLNN